MSSINLNFKIETKFSKEEKEMSLQNKPKLFTNFKDIDGILNSKFAPLFVTLMDDALKNRLIKNKIFPNFWKKERQNDLWTTLYKECLCNKKGLLPNIAYMYILSKVKLKHFQILKESKTDQKNSEEFATYYMKQCVKLRNKIVEKKRQMKIELENTEYFVTKSPRKNGFMDILTNKFGGLLSKNPQKSDNVLKVFDFNDRQDNEKAKEENSSDEDRKQINMKTEMEKIRSKMAEEKKIIENDKKKNKKYLHIKSKFRISSSIGELTLSTNYNLTQTINLTQSATNQIEPNKKISNKYFKFPDMKPSISIRNSVGIDSSEGLSSIKHSGRNSSNKSDFIKYHEKKVSFFKSGSRESLNTNINENNKNTKIPWQSVQKFMLSLPGLDYTNPNKSILKPYLKTKNNILTNSNFFSKNDFYYK